MTQVAPRSRKLSRAIMTTVGGYLSLSVRYVLFLDAEGNILQELNAPWTPADRREIITARQTLHDQGTLQAVVHVGVVEEPFMKLSFVENFDEPTMSTIHVLATLRDHTSHWIAMDEAIIDQWLSYWSEEGGN